jgi:Na+/H+-dicarboxylate symporter
LLKSFFSVVPYNLLGPIRDFNTAQLILMGIIFAYATMAVGQQAGGIASLIHELNLVSMQLAQWIAQLMPVFMVFLTALLVLSHNAQLLVSLVSVIPFALLVSALVTVVVLLFVSQRMGVKPLVLLKKVWPPFIQTIKTGHVSDSYALAEKVCIRDLGIQKIYTQKVLPLGLVLYMPASMVGMISFVIYAAFMSGIDITPVWIIRAIVFALILLVAAPPIPGVNLLSYVVIIGQLGIAKEYVLAAVVFDIIFDSFGAAANQLMLQLDMLLQAEHVGLLNHKIMTQLK